MFAYSVAMYHCGYLFVSVHRFRCWASPRKAQCRNLCYDRTSGVHDWKGMSRERCRHGTC
eukprot:537993-Rhodomonas_salina.1